MAKKANHGYVYLDEMTIKVDFNINKKLMLIKIPPFQHTYAERESLGNGWYGSKEYVNETVNNAYLVINDGKPFAWIRASENGRHYFQPKNSNKHIKNLIEKYNGHK